MLSGSRATRWSERRRQEMTDGPELEQELSEAISEVMGRHGNIVVKWCAMVEAVDGDDRALWTFADGSNIKSWETLGMLMHGLLKQAFQGYGRVEE